MFVLNVIGEQQSSSGFEAREGKTRDGRVTGGKMAPFPNQKGGVGAQVRTCDIVRLSECQSVRPTVTNGSASSR